MILDDIVAFKRIQVEDEKRALGKYVDDGNRTGIRDFRGALGSQEISIIGEVKKASPSKGIIIEDFQVERIAEIYERINIDAISVLTERQFLRGRMSILRLLRE